ncbi:scavenger receptor cysteine-rich domain-containing protein DMBT1-like [Centroberyx affinis]|uniref:scavenger receptor cysteine-rich domain-containing protein DMBT1-like n=1 Tax=Centroberyx affinis TaxID=166261 RepID=UPI003A5C142A
MKDAEVVCREVGCGKAESVDYNRKFGQSSGQFGIRDVACSGEERSLIHCPHRRERFDSQYIGVICSGPVRLVSGTDECSGRVEVYKYGEWGTVCDDDWDMKEAEVVCRQLNCGRALYVKQRAHFGKGSGEIWMSGVKCTGVEGSLTHCHHKHRGLHSCGHNRDAGVVCSRSVHVRLVNGTSRCSGRAEVFHDGQWGRVDDDGWDLNEAKVVCRELGCGKALDAKNNSHFGQGSGEIRMTDVKCSGLESSLIQCSHLRPETQTHRQDAGVVCSGSSEVRLVNGTSRCSGRVEVYHDAMWRPVCDDNWDLNDGHVVCRELDCGEAVTVQREAYFGSGGRTNRLLEPGCSGNESSITQCPNKRNYVYGCTYREDAGLICSGNVRLVNGYDQCSGRVEVYRNGQWGTVCDDDWDTRDAEVVCRELGCGRPLNVKDQSYFGESGGEVLLAGLTCSGSEDSLLQCPHDQSGPRNCGHHQDVGVICTESVKVRLVNGSDRCSGRVEVYYNGQWGAVCGDDWDMKDAEVVCREVVCGRAQSVGDDYGQGSGQHWLDGLECLGNESSLTQCSHKGFGRHECRHTVDAAVRCSAMVRLASGGPCHGRVEVYHDGDWGTVCSSKWDMNNAAVVCRELDCRTPVSITHYEAFGSARLSGRIWKNLGCSGHESALSQCNLREQDDSYSCMAFANVGVYCSDVVRLVNGSGRCSGKVEVYHSSQWGVLCGDGWDRPSADVVCRQLGCGDVVKLYHSDPRNTTEFNMSCSGQESSVKQCIVERVDSGCSLNGNAAVVCSVSDSRLLDGINRCSGRVEHYRAGQWTERCYSAGTREAEIDAEAVCRHLGCGGLRHLLPNCATKTPGVICGEETWVRLANGTDRCSGRVEVYHGGQWGTLCDDDWGLKDAEVVCEEMGCGQPRTVHGRAFFGKGSGPIWQANDRCFTDEMSLMRCSLRGFNTTSCGHSQDAGVVCSESVRLVNGTNCCSGRVEIFRYGKWSTVCDIDWGMTQAGVVCRQLGCGVALQAPTGVHFGRSRGPVLKHSMECGGGEKSLNQCSHHTYTGTYDYSLPDNLCDHSQNSGVICSGPMPKPEIFASPSAEVKWGTRVDISCSFRALGELLGGLFTLEQTSGSFRLERESSSNTVTFVIPNVDYGHEGSYRCRYQKRLEDRDVSTPHSDSIRLNVAAP